MPSRSLFFALVLCASVPVLTQAATREMIPAGTLLNCTVSEPNFSPKTAQVGDPVLCHLGPVGSFGHSLFPRGAELGGHLDDDKAPGHFVGKGWMQLTFDRVILPGAEVLPLEAKIISTPHMKVDAEGKIRGKGHPVRDSIEWAIPIMWPIKIMTLARRGPYPALKGETRLSLRLMEDVEVPFSGAPRPPWASPAGYHVSSSRAYRRASASLQEVSDTVLQVPDMAHLRLERLPQIVSVDAAPPVVQVAMVTRNTTPVRSSTVSGDDGPMTVIALAGGEAYLAREYWVQGGEIHCVSADGDQKTFPLENVDLYQTASLNRERNLKFVLQAKSPIEQ